MGWFNHQLEVNMEPENNILQKWKRKNIHTKHDNCWVPALNGERKIIDLKVTSFRGYVRSQEGKI